MNRPGIADLPVKSLSRSLTRRVLLISLIGVVGLGGTIALGFLMTLYQVQARMHGINDEAVSVFDRFFLDIQSDLRATSDGLAARDDQNAALLALRTRNSAFLDLFFISPDGTILAQRNVVGRPKLTKIEQLAWLESPLTFGKVVIGPVRFEGENPYVDMAITATDDIGLPAGLLLVRVDLIELWNTTLNVKVGDSGYAYIADNTGQLVAFRNRRLLETGSSLEKLVGRTPQAIAESRLSFYNGLSGEPVLASAQPLKTVPWFAVVEQPAYEALAPFMIPAFVLLLAFVIVGLLLYNTIRFTRVRIVSPLLTLRNAVGQMADGQLNQSVEIRHNDELGQLAQAFNQMIGQLQQAFVDLESQIDVLRQAQVALRESEQKFRGVVEQASDGIVLTDEHGNVVEWNRTQEGITGLSAGDVIGQPLWDIQFQVATPDRDTPSLREQVKASMLECLQTGQAPWMNQLTEQDIQHSDGTHRIVQSMIFTIKIKTGFLLGSIIRDITERKQAEQALSESELQYRTTLEAMGEPIHVVDRDLRFVLFNQAFVAWNQKLHLPTEVLGENLFEVFSFLPESVREEYSRVFQTSEILKTEDRTQLGGQEILTETRKIPIFREGQVFQVLTVINNTTERKQAEQKLRESEARYRSLFEDVPVGLYRTMLSGQILDINRAGIRMFGYEDREEVIAHNTSDFWVDLEARKQLASQMDRDGTYDLEIQMRRRDQNIIWVHNKGRATRDEQGQILYYEGSLEDITERKLANKTLQESEGRYRAISELMSDYTFSARVESDGRIVPQWVAGAFQRITGYSWEEFIALGSWPHIVHPDDWPNDQLDLKALLENRLIDRELRIVTKNGEVRWIQNFVRPVWNDQLGRVTELIGAVRDISERKRAEDALRESEEKFRRLFETSRDFLYITNLDGEIIEVNKAASTLSGYSVDELKKINIQELYFDPNDRDLMVKEISKRGFVENLEIKGKKKDGTVFDALVTSTVIKDDDGFVVGFQGNIKDISERKQAEEALRESERRERERAAELQTIMDSVPAAVSIAHDPMCQVITGNRTVYELLHMPSQSNTSLTAPASQRPGHFKIYIDGIEPPPNELPLQISAATGVEIREIEEDIVFDDGTVIHLLGNVTPLFDEQGRSRGAVAAFVDITERKRAEEQLRQSEEALRKAQQVSHVGSWAWHIQENQLEWSDEMYRIFGIEKESFTGELADVIARTIHPDDRAAVEQSNLSVIHVMKPIPLEYRIVWPDGTVRTVWAEAGELMLDAEGKPLVLTGIVADITERKRAEEALQYQNRLQALLMKISTGYINLPLEAVESAIRASLGELAEFVGADRAYIFDYDFHKQVAINTHEWCGKGIKSQIVELQAVPLTITPEWVEVHRRGEPMYVPDVLSLPPGMWRNILEQQDIKSLLAVPLMSSGECIGSVGFDSVKQQHAYSENEQRLLTIFANMLVNIRQRKHAEQALQESEDRFRNLSSMTSEGIMIHTDGIILDANQAFAELIGCSNPDNLIGMNGLEVVPLTSESRQRILKTLGADFTETFEIELVKSDGSILPAETSGKKITYRGRQASLVSMRDITERKRAEEALLRDVERSKALARIAARLNASLELQDVLNVVCEQVARVLDAPVAMIWLADEELQASQIQASYGLPAELYEQIQPVPNRIHPLFQEKLENIYYVPDIQEVLDIPNLPLFYKVGLHTVMICLFYHEGHFIGILSVFRKEVGWQFSEADVTLLHTLSHQIAIAIYNAQLYEQVKAGRERLQDMSEKLVNIQEAERRHLAIELHDEIGQALVHIKMSLDRFDPANPEKGNLEAIREMILDLMNRVRGLSLELRPTILDDLGLLPAVLWHIERYTTLTGIRVDFKHSGVERRFRAQVESTAYRILQESLTNIYRHAGATLVTVSLWADEERLGLQVEDNGAGFEPAAAHQVMTGGLSGMRERANVCGGQLLIDSRLKHGTYISLELPLQDKYVERRTR